MKLSDKERVKGHVRRKYDKPQTPYQRMLVSAHVPADAKAALMQTYEGLNPAELKRRIDAKLKLLYQVYCAKHPETEPNKDKCQAARPVRFSFGPTTPSSVR
ncbi:MAG: hypothetical protein NVS1B10_08810 [Candidatus Saccharimonadales bacterium]